MRTRWFDAALVVMALGLGACKKPYRVGEHVLVRWEDGSPQLYPAYVLERVSQTRYKVHFEGYDARFDEDVGVDRIEGRVEGPVPTPPPPRKVARAVGSSNPTDAGAALLVNPYKPSDRVRVRWRGSIYTATVLEVVSKDRVRIHYEGFENAWDEIVLIDRIVARR
ncbi:MAG TPA: Tudor-knot domain-containing protein [Polyangiaceae bacterium]|nr:Tudor-knot domain-containing protein [Polyangiaceae bacterium]